jgi:hypothetical protein
MTFDEYNSYKVIYNWDEYPFEADKNLLGDYPYNVGTIIACREKEEYTMRGVQLANCMYVVEVFEHAEKIRTVIPVKDKYSFTGFFDLEEIDWAYFPTETPPPEETSGFDMSDEI